jgi:hypothetical protein
MDSLHTAVIYHRCLRRIFKLLNNNPDVNVVVVRFLCDSGFHSGFLFQLL